MPILVSVIVPIFNAEKYLLACIESIAKQKINGDMEIICVDDGSSDNSICILRNLASVYQQIQILQQSNQGLSAARNSGLDKARGKYIVFVDADDKLGGKSCTGNELQSLIDPLENDASVDFSVGKVNVVYEFDSDRKLSDANYYKLPFLGKKQLSDQEIFELHCSAWSKCFRKKIIDELSLRYPINLHFEDAYWHPCYMCKHPVGYGVDRVVYSYFRRESGIMFKTFQSKDSKLAFEHILIAELIYKNFQKLNLLNQKLELLLKIFETSYHFALWHSSEKDALLIMWKTGEILRKNQINCTNSTLLSDLKSGLPERIFSYDKNIEKEAIKWRKLMEILEKIFPPNTFRRKIAINSIVVAYSRFAKHLFHW